MAAQILQGMYSGRLQNDLSIEGNPSQFVVMIGGIYCGFLEVETVGGDIVTLIAPATNSFIPIVLKRIVSGDITAGNIIALW